MTLEAEPFLAQTHNKRLIRNILCWVVAPTQRISQVRITWLQANHENLVEETRNVKYLAKWSHKTCSRRLIILPRRLHLAKREFFFGKMSFQFLFLTSQTRKTNKLHTSFTAIMISQGAACIVNYFNVTELILSGHGDGRIRRSHKRLV